MRVLLFLLCFFLGVQFYGRFIFPICWSLAFSSKFFVASLCYNLPMGPRKKKKLLPAVPAASSSTNSSSKYQKGKFRKRSHAFTLSLRVTQWPPCSRSIVRSFRWFRWRSTNVLSSLLRVILSFLSNNHPAAVVCQLVVVDSNIHAVFCSPLLPTASMYLRLAIFSDFFCYCTII